MGIPACYASICIYHIPSSLALPLRFDDSLCRCSCCFCIPPNVLSILFTHTVSIIICIVNCSESRAIPSDSSFILNWASRSKVNNSDIDTIFQPHRCGDDLHLCIKDKHQFPRRWRWTTNSFNFRGCKCKLTLHQLHPIQYRNRGLFRALWAAISLAQAPSEL